MPIISQRVVDLFTQEKFTGWKTYPVTVFDKKREGPVAGEAFYGLAVYGRGGPQNLDVGVKKFLSKKDGSKTLLGMRGLYFHSEQWDRSDIFLVNDTWHLLVRRKVLDAMKRAKIIGWIEEELDDVGFGSVT